MEDIRQVLPDGAFITGDAAYTDIVVAFDAWLLGIRQVMEAAFGTQAFLRTHTHYELPTGRLKAMFHIFIANFLEWGVLHK